MKRLPLHYKSNCSLTEAVSVENYKILIFRYDFTHIQVYLCRVSFLTTLDIYKDYFKVRHTKCNLMQSDAIQCKLIVHANCDERQNLS